MEVETTAWSMGLELWTRRSCSRAPSSGFQSLDLRSVQSRDRGRGGADGIE